MIVEMKKISLIVLEKEKEQTLKKLRHLGLVQIKVSECQSAKIVGLRENVNKLEETVFSVSEGLDKNTIKKTTDMAGSLKIANRVLSIAEDKKTLISRISRYKSELERLKGWGEVIPDEILALSKKGINISLYEMPTGEYNKLTDNQLTIVNVGKDKKTVKFLVVLNGSTDEESLKALEDYKIQLPKRSTAELKKKIFNLDVKVQDIEVETLSYASYLDSLKEAINKLQKEIEFETYSTGMGEESLSDESETSVTVAYLSGYIPTEDLDELKTAAKENSWGLLIEDPAEDDDVPTKLKNNKLVSLIYPLTDFLGTVPGYFEYDISGWFLGFILIFFGIIFGDGGYGLLICAVATALIIKSKISKKAISPAYWLIELFGGATVLWGTLTCTWFGLSPEQLPQFLRSLSIPFISNVNADRIWHPFWTTGDVGLTTAQNVQIFCFTLALVQLTVAHIKGAVRHRKSLKILGDIGSVLQLIGIYYVVLSLVVNSEVFGLGLVIGSIPVGTVAIALVGIGFVMNFVFASYEGSIGKSILSSLQNIVSVLLGVVNVFSDIVSYIRLWAVGLAGAAISATVNELAGPLLGNFMFMILAIVLLVFGHGLNMILNVLSVIVHGVRLNTLEFSSHLDMSWSGSKFEPFEE